MMQCLTSPAPIIGITDSDCDCVIYGKTTDQIADLRKSSSKLYMNRLPGGIDMDATMNISDCQNILQLAAKARDQAYLDFETRLTESVNTKYKGSKKNFSGTIGEYSYTGVLPVAQQFQGAVLSPNDYTDGVITLNQLQLILNGAGAVTVKVYRVPKGSVMGDEIYSWPVMALPNVYTPVNIGTDPIILPMIYNNQLVEYYFAYDLSAGMTTARPLNTQFICQCQGRTFDWKQFITAKGFQAASMSLLNDKALDGNYPQDYSRGLIFNVGIKCDSGKLFCNEYRNQDAIAITMANAVWYLAGYWLIEYVAKQKGLTSFNTSQVEKLTADKKRFLAEADYRIKDFLTATIDLSDSNCFVCREQPNQPIVRTMFV